MTGWRSMTPCCSSLMCSTPLRRWSSNTVTGRAPPAQLTELLRQKFNVSPSQAEDLLWLALDELEKANLLQVKAVTTQAPRLMLTRRQAMTAFAAAGLSLAILPIVSTVSVAHAFPASGTTTTTEPPTTTTTTEPPTTTTTTNRTADDYDRRHRAADDHDDDDRSRRRPRRRQPSRRRPRRRQPSRRRPRRRPRLRRRRSRSPASSRRWITRPW